MKFGCLICPCELETMLSVADIERITALPTNGHRFETYVNFVCPECGMCSQYRFDDIPTQTSERPALERIGLFHADLKCEGKNCATRTVVHTSLGHYRQRTTKSGRGMAGRPHVLSIEPCSETANGSYRYKNYLEGNGVGRPQKAAHNSQLLPQSQ